MTVQRSMSLRNVVPVAVEIEEKDKKPKFNNDIKEIRTLKHLDKANLDFESPRLKQALDDLGISVTECQKK